jgi:hypothetical protein
MEIAKSEYDFYKLKVYLDPKQILWWKLVSSEHAIYFIEKHLDILDKKCLEKLSKNPFAVPILEKHIDKISWNDFVYNPNCIHVIEKNIDICFDSLNNYGRVNLIKHPNFIYIIKNNLHKIIDKLLTSSCLTILASQQNTILIDLLEQFMRKYPDKIPNKYACYFWNDLCENPYAIHIIEQYFDKLTGPFWRFLAKNPNAIHILEQNLDKLDELGWNHLSENPNAISILQKNIDKINWYSLSNNINGIKILEKYPERITCYKFLDYNKLSVNSCIFELNYDCIQKKCSIYKEELLAVALHPSRIEAYLNQGIPIEDLDKYI